MAPGFPDLFPDILEKYLHKAKIEKLVNQASPVALKRRSAQAHFLIFDKNSNETILNLVNLAHLVAAKKCFLVPQKNHW